VENEFEIANYLQAYKVVVGEESRMDKMKYPPKIGKNKSCLVDHF
jgi:hypothetical protein